MQFSCNQDTFSKYLNSISRVVSSKPGLPILNNVLFEARNGKLLMTVTNLEIGMHCWIGAEVKEGGKITVPAKQLSEFVNSIPSEKIDIELEKQLMKLNTVNNSAEFNTIPSDDYPAVAQVDKEKPDLKISKEDILKAVHRVAFAAATDDIKPVLTGIRIEIKKNIIAFIAIDGLRLSRQVIKLDKPRDKELELLVPAKAMLELAHIVSEFDDEDGDDFVNIYVVKDKNQVLFRFNDIDLVSRVIDGQFPAYEHIIPTGFQTQCKISRSEFQNALKITNIIARSVLGNKIILELQPDEKNITLSASQAEVGSNKSSFNAEISGEPLSMAFSARLMNDMLSNMDSEDILLEATTPVAAGMFKIEGDDDFIHLIMPMRL